MCRLFIYSFNILLRAMSQHFHLQQALVPALKDLVQSAVVDHKLERASESPGGLSTSIAGPHWFLILEVDMGWGPRIWISSKFSSSTHEAA